MASFSTCALCGPHIEDLEKSMKHTQLAWTLYNSADIQIKELIKAQEKEIARLKLTKEPYLTNTRVKPTGPRNHEPKAWNFDNAIRSLVEERASTDKKKTVQHFETAAHWGNADACFNLGLMYHVGDGVYKARHTAKEWYEKALKIERHPEALCNLGILDYPSKDNLDIYQKKRIIELLKESADLGSKLGAENLKVIESA